MDVRLPGKLIFVTRTGPGASPRLGRRGPETTLWEQASEYRFDSLLMRLLARLVPGSFHKQSQQHMQDFKAFAEQGKDVREGRN